MKFFAALIVIIFSVQITYADRLREATVYGSSIVRNDSEDMWDKKNEAIYDAKKKATLQLAQKVFKPETFETYKKRIKKEIIPYSGNYIVTTEVLSHGLEEEGEFQSYNAKVQIKYSFENFKNFLLRKGLKPDNLELLKVAAFIEVMDLTEVTTYSWWTEEKPSLHPVLKPLQAKLGASLKEEGYELLPIRVFNNKLGMKDMAKAMGAQYYINGSIKIVDAGSAKYKVKEGLFNFHETLSQKFVTQVDLKKFSKELQGQESAASAYPSRGIASLSEAKKVARHDVIAEAFMDAARTMSSVENIDQLSQGLTEIHIQGLSSPVQLKALKQEIYSNLRESMSSLTERKIQSDKVTLLMRTSLRPRQLVQKMAFMRSQGYKGEVSPDGEAVYFKNY